MSNNNASFLNLNGMTVEFQPLPNGQVRLTYQNTTDPNEELNDETFTVEAARAEWKRYISEGAKRTKGWHATGRCYVEACYE